MILDNQSSKPDSHFTVVPIEAFQKMLTNSFPNLKEIIKFYILFLTNLIGQ